MCLSITIIRATIKGGGGDFSIGTTGKDSVEFEYLLSRLLDSASLWSPTSLEIISHTIQWVLDKECTGRVHSGRRKPRAKAPHRYLELCVGGAALL